MSLLSPKALDWAVEACKKRVGDVTRSKLSGQLGWEDAAVLVVVTQVPGAARALRTRARGAQPQDCFLTPCRAAAAEGIAARGKQTWLSQNEPRCAEGTK